MFLDVFRSRATALGDVLMFLRDYDCSAGFGAKRDAIEGFASIAAGLDSNVDAIGHGSNVTNLLAIGLGWLLLSAIIVYPAFQLAAYAVCIAFVSLRTLVSFVFSTASITRSSSRTLSCQ